MINNTEPYLSHLYVLCIHHTQVILHFLFDATVGTNNGNVKFTNLPYPLYNAFPPTVAGPTSGAASVYFQGESNNTLTCNGITTFYNLIVDKGIDRTYKLTINSTSYENFRLFGGLYLQIW